MLGVLLAVGTVVYLAALPRNLGPADEAIHLYEAKRVLQGDVMYRDVFEIITPGWMYLMALLFRVFGTGMATARIAMAVIHAGTMLMIGVTGRRLGVRPALAWTASFAYLAVCQSAWPIASQHWLSTFLCVLLLLVLIARDGRGWRSLFAAGVVLGLIIGVQQQRGVLMSAGVGVWVLVDLALARRVGPASSAPSLWTALLALGAGVAVVVVPLLVWIIAAAGFEPVWRALVIHPLTNYAATNQTNWGDVNVMTGPQARFTYPRTLLYLPLALVPLVPRVIAAVRRRDGATARPRVLLIAFSLTSMASIAYFPDFIHIAFIAPVFFVAIADTLEWLLARASGRRWARPAGCVAVAALVAAFSWQLTVNYAVLWRLHPIALETAFGRIDVARPVEAQLYERTNQLLANVPSRGLFCYPVLASLYLMADARNPTRYGFLHSKYSSPDQLQEVVDTLKAAQLPYIVGLRLTGLLTDDDPIFAYVDEAYEPLGTAPVDSFIFRRKDPS